MKRNRLMSLAPALFLAALLPLSGDAQTCSCPWKVVQGEATGVTSCDSAHNTNANNLKSYTFWTCNNTAACTTVYTPLSCTDQGNGTFVVTGLMNYKCC
jgi:hypothetical protein